MSQSCMFCLLLTESDDELEADNDVADSREKCSNNRKQTGDDVTNSPFGFVGRRMLPAPPGGADKDAEAVAKNVQRRQDATDRDNGTDEDKDVGAFAITSYDAPLIRRDLHPRGSAGSDGDESNVMAKTTWTVTMLSLAESKLQVRRVKPESQERDSTPSMPTRTVNRTKTSTLADLTLNNAKVTPNVIVSSGKQLPATIDHFVPISNGASMKPAATKSGRPASDLARSKTKGPASSGPNVGGSRSARTTPQQAPSPTKDIRQQSRFRSKSNARDEYDRTKTTTTSTTTAAGARYTRVGVSDATRRNVVSAVETTRRYRTRDDVASDATTTTTTTAQQRTATRQSALPPAPTISRKLRSTSQKRSGEVGGVTRQQPARTTQDTTSRSQYARSPERSRTSTRQADFVSRMTADAGSRSMYRSSSASVLPTPRRAASRSPQRPFASSSDQERLQQAREAFKKRMSYDPSKSAAMGRAAAAAGGRRVGISAGGSFGSSERLSPTSSGSRRSRHGSVNGLSDEDAFARPATVVAKYSNSVASNISALSQHGEPGRALSTIDVDDDVSTDTVSV